MRIFIHTPEQPHDPMVWHNPPAVPRRGDEVIIRGTVYIVIAVQYWLNHDIIIRTKIKDD